MIEKNDLEKYYEECTLLIQYCTSECINIDQNELEVLINVRHKESLTSQDEATLLRSIKSISHAIQPVTTRSIKDSLLMRASYNKEKPKSGVNFFYGFFCLLFAFLSICVQVYCFIGVDVIKDAHRFFEERNKIKMEISVLRNPLTKKTEAIKDDISIYELNNTDNSDTVSVDTLNNDLDIRKKTGNKYKLLFHKSTVKDDNIVSKKKVNDQYELLDQKFDATFHILEAWIDVIPSNLIKNLRVGKLTKYDDLRLKQELETSSLNLNKKDERNKKALEIREKRELSEARNHLFKTLYLSKYITEFLMTNLLPFFYGILGALIFVLRDLHNRVKRFLFTSDKITEYNVRILLSGVTGMVFIWLFNKTEILTSAGFTNYIIAFLIGYNIEIFFSFIDNLSSKIIEKVKVKSK